MCGQRIAGRAVPGIVVKAVSAPMTELLTLNGHVVERTADACLVAESRTVLMSAAADFGAQISGIANVVGCCCCLLVGGQPR